MIISYYHCNSRLNVLHSFFLLQLTGRISILNEWSIFLIPHRQKPIFAPPRQSGSFFMDKKHDGVCHCAFCVNSDSVKKVAKNVYETDLRSKMAAVTLLMSLFEGRGLRSEWEKIRISPFGWCRWRSFLSGRLVPARCQPLPRSLSVSFLQSSEVAGSFFLVPRGARSSPEGRRAPFRSHRSAFHRRSDPSIPAHPPICCRRDRTARRGRKSHRAHIQLPAP